MGHITFWSDDALHCFVTHISRDNVTVKPLGMGWTELALYFERACIFLSCFVQIESILILSKVFVHVASSYKFYQGLVFRTKDDIVYPSLHPEAAARRVRRTVGNSTANFQEVLKNLGKLIMSNDRQTCVYVVYTCFSNLFLRVNRARRSD